MEKPKCSLVPVSPMQAPAAPAAIDDGFIKSRIFTIRGVQVVLDRDLAELYGVATKALNQAVRRNSNRFPEEFMFTLSKDETDELVTNCDRFLIIDDSVYHIGASVKDLGKKWFAVSLMEAQDAGEIVARLVADSTSIK